MPPPSLLFFDSGLGGLSVFREVKAHLPKANYTYVADDICFPYGDLSEAQVLDRVISVLETHFLPPPDIVVIACHTASTLVLSHLRARWPHIFFVGTVPAIKPAAHLSQTGLISILATPGTVARTYTLDLIQKFADDCEVTLVGSPYLASMAEDRMRGKAVDLSKIKQEIVPCFQEKDGQKTDVIVLACTHYPFLLDVFLQNAPWPVTWLDPAPAIAQRVLHVLEDLSADDEGGFSHTSAHLHFTSHKTPETKLASFLAELGFVM